MQDINQTPMPMYLIKNIKSICLFTILFLSFSGTTMSQEQKIVPNEYVGIFSDEAFTPFLKRANTKELTHRHTKAKLFKKHNRKFKKHLTQWFKKNGFENVKVLRVSSGLKNYFHLEVRGNLKAELKKYLEIKYLAPDTKYTCRLPINIPGLIKPDVVIKQTKDWGLAIVKAKNTSGVGKFAFVVDTGVDFHHPDLTVDTTLSSSFITTEATAQDFRGHGTHVSGIIAAKDNLIGVKGVAAGATIIGVKVFDSSGSTQGSSTLFGADYVAVVANSGDVANFSLGRPGTNVLLEDAIENGLACNNIYCSIAAGNINSHASGTTPARLNAVNVYTVSNMNQQLEISANSNYGNGPVDFAAPGTLVYSTDLVANGYYSTKSGTSMAAPHVAGILLVNNGIVNTNGTVTTDKDATLDQIASVK